MASREEIIALYVQTDERLRALVEQLEAGNSNARLIAELNLQIDLILTELTERAGHSLAALIGEEYRAGATAAVSQLAAAGITANSSLKSVIHQRAAQAIMDEAFYSILKASEHMSEDSKQRITNAVRLANEKSLTLGMSRREATKQAIDEINSKGITGVIASNGAHIPADKYMNGVVHYHQRKAHVTGTENMAAQNGYDLVYVNYVGITCEHCARKQGRVYSLSGNDMRWPHMTDEYKPPYHSHCVHSMSIWIEEYQSPEEVARLLEISNKKDAETRSEQHIRRYKEIQAKKAQLNADRKQFDRYRKVVPETPKSFSAFRQLKKNNHVRWEFMQLDYRRQKRLLDHPELALPHAATVMAADAKFSKYLFNPENKKGYAKGTAFTSRLGYNIDNWKELQKEITQRATRYPATYKKTNDFGNLYEQKIVIYGKHNKPANVVVGWIINDSQTKMTSAYIKEVSADAED